MLRSVYLSVVQVDYYDTPFLFFQVKFQKQINTPILLQAHSKSSLPCMHTCMQSLLIPIEYITWTITHFYNQQPCRKQNACFVSSKLLLISRRVYTSTQKQGLHAVKSNTLDVFFWSKVFLTSLQKLDFRTQRSPF